MYQNKYNGTLLTARTIFRIQYIYNYLLNTEVWMPVEILKFLLSTTRKQMQNNALKYFDPGRMICIISNNKKHFTLDE
jgi:hypothetical protein